MAKAATGQPVRSAERMLSVLKCFTIDSPTHTVAEISDELSLAPSTVRRLLAALQSHGFVRLNTLSNRFELGFQILQLAAVAQASLDLVRAADSVLSDLCQTAEESVQLTVLDGATVVIVAAREPERTFGIFHSPGHRHPAWVGSAPGKVMLAALPEPEVGQRLASVDWTQGSRRAGRSAKSFAKHLATVRRDGYATNDGETAPDVWAVAAPVRDHTGAVIASINVPCPATAVTEDRRERLTDLTVRAADRLSAELGYAPHGP